MRQNLIELNDNFIQWGVEPNLVYDFYTASDIIYGSFDIAARNIYFRAKIVIDDVK